MDTYDPNVAPEPAAWLALEEAARMGLARRAHADLRDDVLHTADLNVVMHGALHAIVENQIASADPAITAQTVARLMDDGLKRHPALHGVMRVLAEHIGALKAGSGFDQAGYARDLDALRAADLVAGALKRGPAQFEPQGRNRAERRKRR